MKVLILFLTMCGCSTKFETKLEFKHSSKPIEKKVPECNGMWQKVDHITYFGTNDRLKWIVESDDNDPLYVICVDKQ
jgi:hypothetical protein